MPIELDLPETPNENVFTPEQLLEVQKIYEALRVLLNKINQEFP